MNAKDLATLMSDFAPNTNLFPEKHKEDLSSALWSLCRQHGMHGLAESLTAITNKMRAAQWEVLGAQKKWVVTATMTPTNFNKPHSFVVEAATEKDAKSIVKHRLRDLRTYDNGSPREQYDYETKPFVEPPVGRIVGEL